MPYAVKFKNQTVICDTADEAHALLRLSARLVDRTIEVEGGGSKKKKKGFIANAWQKDEIKVVMQNLQENRKVLARLLPRHSILSSDQMRYQIRSGKGLSKKIELWIQELREEANT